MRRDGHRSAPRPVTSSSRRWRWSAALLGGAAIAAAATAVLLTRRDLPTRTPKAQAAPSDVGYPVVAAADSYDNGQIKIDYAAAPVADRTDLTEISVTLTDPATSSPLARSAPPSAWIARTQASTSAAAQPSCDELARTFVQATFDATPEVDLNSYFILTLNDDGTVSVIDPVGGVKGISQLYAMPVLDGRGADWSLAADGERLFVTIPDKDRVAVIDTKRFEVVASIEAGQSPHRIVAEPDGRRLWVADDGGSGGVTVIDAATLDVVGFVPTGRGQHEIAFSGASSDGHVHGTADTSATPAARFAFVSNADDGTVAVVDVADLGVHARVRVADRPRSIAYSSAVDRVYVAGDTSGTSVIDNAEHQVVGVIDTPPGATDLRFAPGGRYAFALSPAAGAVTVIDSTTGKVVHTLPVPGADRVSFSPTYAYVHSTTSSQVELVDLTGLSKPEKLPTVRITGGQQASSTDGEPNAGDLIVPVSGHGGHVLIDNPADKQVYSYMEGMNAPMGSYDTYGAAPQAVLVVDRSLRQTAPGVYRTTTKIPSPGQYLVVVRDAESNVVHCFDLRTVVAHDEGIQAGAVKVLSTDRHVAVGSTLSLQFAVTDASGSPVADAGDLTVIVTTSAGSGNERIHANPRPDGTYEAALQFGEPGAYLAYVTAPSLSITAADNPPISITAIAPEQP